MFEGCQRLEGSIVLSDGFPERTNFSSIIVIAGNVGGGGYSGDPLSLEGLDSLEVVEGSLAFVEDNLVDYTGVPNLRSVGGLSARGVPELRDFRGLENLTEVGGTLTITRNPKVESLEGLERLQHVRGDVLIGDNPLLPPEDVETLLRRVTVDGEVNVW
ncbi:MAG: hypothetical protein ACE37F_06445 [Nannocystaceae bacterium]|nr:hypothetical protein [bacterium]